MPRPYQCPKTHGEDFVRVAKTYRYEPRTFLGLFSWVAEIHTGFIVRCPDEGCARYWRVGLDGMSVPAGHGQPVRSDDAGREPPPLDDEREAREVAPALGLAIRRPRL